MDENEKIISVQKTAKHFFRTRRIWQYDVGHVLRFDGFNLPFTFQVHFASLKTGEAKPQVGQDGICEVPPEYTQTSGAIHAWVYEVTEDTGLTKHEIEIPVEGRAKPTNQEPTPVEQSVIDQTIAASNNALEKTLEAQQAAEDAAESVKNASATAETLSPGSPATVVVRDVEGVKTFEFGIPEGRKGETGDTPNFTVGSVTTLPAGSPVTVTITGTPENPVLNIGIPQGAQGDKGNTGAVPHFTIGTVTTLPPNSPATVTVTGTDENPILNLGIPKGIQGQKGDKGDAFTYADFTPEQKAELVQGPIKEAQTEAVTAVNNAGTVQVKAVNDAGAAQVKAVQDKGQEVRESIPPDYSALTDDVNSLKSALTLQEENVPGTTQTISFDSVGNVSQIVHSANGVAVRTDVFTFGADTITEVRTLSTGESLTIVTNTDTLVTTTTYADAA